MKTTVSMVFCMLFWLESSAQFEICLDISDQCQMTVKKDGNTTTDYSGLTIEKGGNLVINNNPVNDSVRVVLKQVSQTGNPFRFEFGYNSNPKITLAKGKNTFKINPDGQVEGFPQDKKFQFPCVISIVHKDPEKTNWSETIQPDKNNMNIRGPDYGRSVNKKFNGLTKVPFYDAFTLSDYTSTDSIEYIKILNFYCFPRGNDYPAKTLTECLSQYKHNKLLYDKLKKIIDKAAADFVWKETARIQGSGEKPLSSFSLSSIGGLDVTNIADGFAKFIVKRTKQELSITFFNKFKETLEKDQYKDLQTLFPQTWQALSIIGDEIYNYEAYIQSLRECFEKDLATLPTTLPLIIDNHPEFFRFHPGLAAGLKSGSYIASALRDKEFPGDILANYPLEYLDTLNKNWIGAVQTLQLFSASLRDSVQSESRYWVKSEQLKKLLKDSTAFGIYLGLLYQQALMSPYDSIQFQNTNLIRGLNSVAKDFSSAYPSWKKYLEGFSEKANKLSALVRNYQKQESDSLTIEQYSGYFTAALDFLRYAAEIGKLKYINLPNLPDTLKVYFDIAQSSVDLLLAVNRRNYASAVINTVNIYNLVLAQKSPEHNNAKRLMFKYGSFMAAVVQAKSSDDVEKAIESFALPTGSSRIKRETPFNVSLNAYCGLFAGFEQIKGIDPGWTWNYQKFNSYGVAAPVGIAFSHGCSGWSSTVFISVIDIGALAAFRFTDDSTQSAPSIKLQDIISPGIFYSLGIPKSPVSINFGWQIGPVLRTVTAKTTTYKNSYTRISVSVCVDIPILNFYTVPKKN